MKARTVFAFALFFGFASNSYAAENGEKTQSMSALTSTQLGDYSLKLHTDEPRQIATVPSGLATLRQENVRPFLGLKLSRPLPDNFWNFGRTGN